MSANVTSNGKRVLSEAFYLNVSKRQQTGRYQDWMSKQLPFAMNMLMMPKEQPYQLELIGEGMVHKVYKFTETDRTIKVNGREYLTENLAFKILHPRNVDPKSVRSRVLESNQSYLQMVEDKVPVPDVYVNPTHFTGSAKIGKFWLVQKMESEIDGSVWKQGSFDELSENDQKILKWARNWFVKMAIEKREIIPDFRIRNTMLDKEGNPVVVDNSPVDGDEDDFCLHLSRYLEDWSSGNDEIYQFFIDKFPDNEILKELKKAKSK